MSAPPNLFAATAFSAVGWSAYEVGNTSFELGQHEQAELHYTQGILCYESNQTDENEECIVLYLKLLLNRSQCRLLLREYDGAIEDCRKVLAKNPDNIKANIRLATALQNIGRYTEAIVLIDSVLSLKLPEQFQRTAIRLRAELRRMQAADNVVKKAEGVPVSFITDHQTIKLSLCSPHIDTMVSGRVYTLKLCLGNEFGLFNKALLPSCDGPGIRIKASIIYLTNDPGLKEGSDPKALVCEHGCTYFSTSGSVDYSFTIQFENGGVSSMTYVLLRFECAAALASGKVVVPVLTLPILLSQRPPQAVLIAHRGKCLLETARKIGAQCIRTIAPLIPRATARCADFLAFECPGYLGIGGKVWDSTYILLDYLRHRSSLIRGKRVVEFGSGTGLAGIALSSLQPFSVCLSDFASVTNLLSANVELNRPLLQYIRQETSPTRDAGSSHCYYSVIGYSWGDEHYTCETESVESKSNKINDVFKKCDVAVASDVVYDPAGYQPLFKAITEFLSAFDTYDEKSAKIFIMAHRHRNPEDKSFFELLESCSGIEYLEDTYNCNDEKNGVIVPNLGDTYDGESCSKNANFNDFGYDQTNLVKMNESCGHSERDENTRNDSLRMGKVRIFIVKNRLQSEES